jgi:acyl-CoA synthetase (NDP forming)
MSVEDLVVQWATPEGRWLNEMESKRLLQEGGIRVADTLCLPTVEEVVRACRALGYPLQVAPLVRSRPPEQVASGLSHTVGSDQDATYACEELKVRVKQWDPTVPVEGFTIRDAPRHAVHLRITVEQDPVLGRVMAAGFGPAAMEVFGDVAYRVVPLAKRDPHLMLSELKGLKLLGGYRGMEPVNLHFIEDVLMRVADFVGRTPEVHAMDLDPIFASRRRVLVHDARVVLRSVNGEAAR